MYRNLLVRNERVMSLMILQRLTERRKVFVSRIVVGYCRTLAHASVTHDLRIRRCQDFVTPHVRIHRPETLSRSRLRRYVEVNGSKITF